MGGQPCFYKQLMNGHRIAGNSQILADMIQKYGAEISDDAAYKIIDLQNTAEDAIDRASTLFLEALGYDGPFPHALSFKEPSPASVKDY